MLTDAPSAAQSFSFDPTVDDFFNLDVLNSAPSAFTNGSSSQSSSSPRSPFAFSTPLTPPSFPPLTATNADDDFFAQFLDADEFTKGPSLSTFSVPSYDIFGAGHTSTSTGGSSPDSMGASTPMFAIDPQLVGTPATSHEHSDPDSETDNDEPDPDPVPVKRSRRGAVASGGIKKASAPPEKETKEGSKSKASKDTVPLKILEPEDWRPSPEEYKKMSSREKRQLRNKISARNFRVRRKEYITTLEGDIAERDLLIDAIRSELGSSRSENIALRQEITALKRCLLESRGQLPDLPPPAELSTPTASIIGAPLSPPGSPAPTTVHTTSSGMGLLTPNTQKDLPTSPRLGARPFWGGFGGMGVTPVHTTLIPHTPVGVKGVLQENINPALQRPGSVVEKNANAHINGLSMGLGGLGAFDAFADTNPFTLKTLDAYRMQLWGKMAAQHGHVHAPSSGMGMGSTPHGLASNLKPAYFTSTSISTSTPSKSLAGKVAYPMPPASPAPGVGSKSAATPTREQAALAAIASQTLLGKLGSAFWEAFSGTSPGNGLGVTRKDWDAEKVRKVLEGRAVVRVVDVEPQVSGSSPSSSLVQKAIEKRSSPSVEKKAACKSNVCDILEESMRSLTISKK